MEKNYQNRLKCVEVIVCYIIVVFFETQCRYKYLSFGAEIVKIGPADPEIIFLRAIIKKRKKLRKVKYIARSAT